MAKLYIPIELLTGIISHCKETYPYEACGIIAGKNRVVQKVFKMKNMDTSSVSYLLEPGEQFTVMKEMRQQGLEMTAIFHSHPYTDAYPSATDIRLAFYEDSFYLIVSLIHEEPVIKAFEIKDGFVTEVEIISILK